MSAKGEGLPRPNLDEGRPSRAKRAPRRLDPSSDTESTPLRAAGKRSRSVTPTRRSKRPRATKRGPGRPRKSSRSPAPRGASRRGRRRSASKQQADDREYEVEGLIDAQLLVKWKNYSRSASTWEPIDGLSRTCGQLVLDYLDELRAQVTKHIDEGQQEEEAATSSQENEPGEEAASTPKRRGRPRKNKE